METSRRWSSRSRRHSKIAFVSYYKGNYELHTIDQREPISTAASSDFGGPGQIIDFQAPLSHTLIPDNKHTKRPFEKMFLDGRPPVNVGVTSSGDVFGGTNVTFSDVLGDKQFNVYAASMSQYRTLAFTYQNISRRFNYADAGILAEHLLSMGTVANVFYDPSLVGLIDRDLALATRTVKGGSVFGDLSLQPLSPPRGLRGSHDYREEFNDPTLEAYSRQYQIETFGQPLFQNGTILPLSATFVAGDHRIPGVRTASGTPFAPATSSPSMGLPTAGPTDDSTWMHVTISESARRVCWPCVLRGYRSWGDAPTFMYSAATPKCAATSICRSSDRSPRSSTPNCASPLIEAMLTPSGCSGASRSALRQHGRRELPGQTGAAGDLSGSRTAPSSTQAPPLLQQDPNTGIITTIPGRTQTVLPDSDSSTQERPTASVSRPWRSDPGALRLGLAHAHEQGLGGRSLPAGRGKPRIPPGAVCRCWNRIRLLTGD